MNQIVQIEDRARRPAIEVQDPVPLLDTSQFEHMQRIASVMARTSLIPESLYKEKDNELPFERIVSNCFLVVNQAVRWGMDPFAVAQCVAVVKGKLCYEGKLVSAVLDAKLGLRLHHHFVGAGDEMRVYLSDREFDDEIIGELKPGLRRPGWRLFDGSVGEWKTTGSNSPWAPKNFARMLVYRGSRDWCRIYEPAIMLGVYTPDEMIDLADNARSLRAREISGSSLQERLAAARAAPTHEQEGFDREFVSRELSTNPGSTPPPCEPEDDAPEHDLPTSSGSVSNPVETPVEAGAEAQEGPERVPASEISAQLRNLMEECVDNILREAFSTPTDDAEGKVERTASIWKLPENLGDHADFVDLCAETARRIIGRPSEREKATAYLMSKVPA